MFGIGPTSYNCIPNMCTYVPGSGMIRWFKPLLFKNPILFPSGFTAIMWLEICRMQNQKYTIIICTVGQTMKSKKSLGFNMGIEALAQLFDPCCQHVPFPGPCCAQPWFVFHESCLSTIGFPQKKCCSYGFF